MSRFAPRQLALAVAVASLGSFPALADSTLPAGGEVSAGAASIGTAGSAMTINQASQRAVIRWNSFSIGSDASVTFNQPNSSAIALNRVLGNDLSRIDGQLNANGQVFITNPNGVLFGAGSQVNVGGLVASTLEMDEAAFMGGNFVLQGSSTASITNEGTLNGQNVALVGARIINTGNITADSAVLAAGERVTLQFDGDGLISASVDAKQLNAFIENGGVISVGEGRLLMTAGTASELTSTVINNTGILQANSISADGGEIVLGGDYLVNTGAIEANGQAGGSITINADRTLMAGAISAEGVGQGGTITATTRRHRETQTSTQSVNGQTAGSIQLTAQQDLFSSGTYTADGDTGGAIDITAQNIELRGATVTATGTGDGGHIRIGGGYQGKDTDIQNATTNTIASTEIDASSTDNGDGGTAIVWSDVQTDFYGTAKATGGANSGDGGFIEISGKELLNFGGTGDASAANGVAGTLLLDPKDIVIDDLGFAPTTIIEFPDPFVSSGDHHGSGLTIVLDDGKVIVSSPRDTYAGYDSGAVYLYSSDGQLISMLTGSQAYDQVGVSSGFTEGVGLIGDSSFYVHSRNWNGYLGALTWGDVNAGVSGLISAENSIIGENYRDISSVQITPLSNGNYVIKFGEWNIGVDSLKPGAYTWIDPDNLLTGHIDSSNSFLAQGSSSQLTTFADGNYVISVTSNYGSITWGNGLEGLVGYAADNNSLVGETIGDMSGLVIRPIYDDNTFMMVLPKYDFESVVDAGAALFLSSEQTVSGFVSEANAFVGSTSGDFSAYVLRVYLSDDVDYYLVTLPRWDNGLAVDAGAVLYVNDFSGVGGVVSSANSLVGSSSNDSVGYINTWSGIEILPSGNYVVRSWSWDNGSAINAGAVTWGSRTLGVQGEISELNSFIGSSADDQIGRNYSAALQNGDYLFGSSSWDNGAMTNAGSVTRVDGSLGGFGIISAENSIVGIKPNDAVGKFIELSNGNIALLSPYWDSDTAANVGAVTLVRSDDPFIGTVSAENSLIGSSANDYIGAYARALPNGNLIVLSHSWDNGAATNAGAVTWIDGVSGLVGEVSSLNSLVGSQSNDGSAIFNETKSLRVLDSGDYLVLLPSWNAWTGAVAWGSGASGVVGEISAANALIGSSSNQRVGTDVVLLENGNYLVPTPMWNGSRGAVTWGDGRNGTRGVVSASNSLIGQTANDSSGMLIDVLPGGNYVVSMPGWDSGALVDVGAVTWGDGAVGVSGLVSDLNSLVGSAAYDKIGTDIVLLNNGNFLVQSKDWNAGAGAVTWVDANAGGVGVISSANSLVGSADADGVGTKIYVLADGNYLVQSPLWDNAGVIDAGAITWGDGNAGISGEVSAGNSLVGSSAGDYLGASWSGRAPYAVTLLSSGGYVVVSQYWDNGLISNAGAVTWGYAGSGVVGEISLTNSLLGNSYYDFPSALNVQPIDQSSFFIGSSNYDNKGFSQSGALYLVALGESAPVGYDGVSRFSQSPRNILNISSAQILSNANAGTNIILQANNDITINSDIIVNNPSGNGGSFTLQAGRNITFNANVFTDNGNLTAIAGDPAANPAYRDTGTPTITIGSGVNLNTGEGVLTLAAIGGNFINNSGPDAITTSGAGYWRIYSSHPDNNTFGGLNSGNQALWNMVYGDAVSAAGNRYIFEYQPTLDFSTIDGQKKGIRKKNINNLYAANGFVDASLYGNVFTQDTVDNSLTGAPNLYSQGAEAWQKAGDYPIVFQGWNTLAATNGYALGSFTDGSNLHVKLSFIDRIRLKIHNILERFRRRR